MIRCFKTLVAGAAAVAVLCAVSGCGDEKYVPKQDSNEISEKAKAGQPIMSPPPPGVVPGVGGPVGGGATPGTDK